MHKITNTISFKGIEQKNKPQNLQSNGKLTKTNPQIRELVSNPVTNPMIQPISSSDYYTQDDLKKLKDVQTRWGKEVAVTFGVPEENILSKFGEIKLGDAKTFLTERNIGGFDQSTYDMKFMPIKEITSLQGGIESKVIHESMHNLCQNSRISYALQSTPEQLMLDCCNIVMSKMLNGEHGLIMSDIKEIEINGQKTLVPQFMNVPMLSAKERQAVVNTLISLQVEHFDLETNRLSDSGEKFVAQTIVPQLEEYSKNFEGKKNPTSEITEKMVKYFNSFFVRRNQLYGHITDIPKNFSQEMLEKFKLPLSVNEMQLAQNTFTNLLNLDEGTWLRNYCIDDEPGMKYFTSHEELLARKEESTYRYRKVLNEIENCKRQGYAPPKKLLQEKKQAIVNMQLVDSTFKFNEIESQIISAPKDIEKVKKIMNSRFYQDITIDADAFYNIENEKKTSGHFSSEKEYRESLSEKVRLVLQKQDEYAKLNRPENLLADTTENNVLKAKFDEVLAKIRKLAPKSDLTGIPQSFFNSEAELVKNTAISNKTFAKWVRRLHV